MKWTRRPNLGYNNPAPITTGAMTDLEFVRLLAAHGADLDARMTKEPRNRYRNVLNRIGSTPFLLAAKAADVKLMRLMVELGADPLLPNEDGTTPLMVAAGVGIWSVGESPGTNKEALEAVRYALEVGGDVTMVDDYRETALHGAIIRGSEPLVRFLLDHGAAIDAVNSSRLLKNTRIGLFSWPSCVSRPPRQRCARGHAVPTRGPATPAAGDQGHLASRFRNRTK